MKRNLEALRHTDFDLVIVGGGITGACLCHDAALRGWRVALLEKGDFGGFTSSASSKLIHGGIRYLPTGQFWKVRESSEERAFFHNIAPHATRTIPFIVPTFVSGWMKGRAAMLAGLTLYEWIGLGLNDRIRDPGKKVPVSRFIGRNELVRRFPLLHRLDGLSGAYILYESHMVSSERMTLAFVKSACRNEAVAANYLQVTDFLRLRDKTVVGVVAEDRFSGERIEVRGRVVVNAAGPHIPILNDLLPELRLKKRPAGYSKGVHLVTRQILPDHALTLTTRKKIQGVLTRGGRHVFIIPWRHRSLIGTTDVPFSGNLDDVRVTESDILDFMEDLNACLPGLNLCLEDVHYAWAGLYPLLVREIKPDTYQGTGEYQIVDHEKQDGIPGIWTVFGAKYTTARRVTEKAADRIAGKLGWGSRCRPTRHAPLEGGAIRCVETYRRDLLNRYAGQVDAEVLDHLLFLYGTETETLIRYGIEEKSLLEPISPDFPSIRAQVVHAVRCEMAMTLSDVLFRRTDIATAGYPGRQTVIDVAEGVGRCLGWDEGRKAVEIEEVEQAYAVIRTVQGKGGSRSRIGGMSEEER
ncbi:glycerol-3-phosphate dehydrogenase/oxidase [Desulfatirhabdium butyrativorans]|uniref:glycerol-3-phosphate dehydrogenase/oxidase n=1 Tax=Desulfatirhabdium butyrativorans TaxID=340467 RepID=UPI00040355D5|nr:glycerol-3-phosphate dehydrogenase/oxidase [Desulfatirhabdium butyrativorans]